jgi:hypothetical protein
MLLLYPPVARSPEPPIGLARLAGWSRSREIDVHCIDLNQEGQEFLLESAVKAEDSWTRGALKRRQRAASALRERQTYGNYDRYARAVGDLDRALRAASGLAGVAASLADYRDPRRSPLRKCDLIDSARNYKANVFYELFERRIGPELESELESNPMGFVGISICYLSQVLCAFALCGYIKSVSPETKITLGGSLVTSWVAGSRIAPGEEFEGFVDAILAGPGEESLGSLLDIPDSRIAGAPRFDDFLDLGYFAPVRIIPYNFSSGCAWKRCSFCPETAENMPYRGKNRETAITELAVLRERYDPGLFHFTDNEIAPLYLRSLMDHPPGAPWYGFARFSRLLLDPKACDELAASGCRMLQLGLESADQDVLDALGKGTRVEEIDRILKNLKASAIAVFLYVIFGTPSEDRNSAMRTRDFVATRAGYIRFLNLALFNLPASGGEASKLETANFYDADLSLYSEFRHPKGWDRAHAREFLEKDFLSVPENRAIFKRTPPVFTSNHAPFFI